MFCRLFDKQKQYEDICDKVELLETRLADSESNIANLEEHLEEKREDIERYSQLNQFGREARRY